MESTCSNTSLFKTINNGKNSSEYLDACSSSGCSSNCSCSCSSSSNRKNKGQNVSREMVCEQTTTALVAHPNAVFYKNPPPRSQPSFSRRHQSRASCSFGISAQPVQSQPFVLSGRLIGRCFERLKAIFQVEHLSEEYINAASILFHTEELCTIFLERSFEGGRHFFIAEMDRLRMEKRL